MNNKNGGCIEGLMSKEGHNCVEIGQNINHYLKKKKNAICNSKQKKCISTFKTIIGAKITSVEIVCSILILCNKLILYSKDF